MAYTMFALDGQMVAGMGQLRQEEIESGQPPGWASTIQREPWDTMFGRMSAITDPQGPTFGIVTIPG